MRLLSLRIQNFRSFKDETINFDSYTCLVGANGAGKSCVLFALNVFFRNSAASVTNVITLVEEDFHHRNTNEPIRITLTFGHLSDEAKELFQHYVRQNQLVITAKAQWDPSSRTAEVKQCGQRLVMDEFKEFFEQKLAKASATELGKTYEKIKTTFSDLPKATSGPTREEALRSYEEAHPERCVLLEADTEFYGWSKGENRLRQFLQWVYIPAVKEVSTEQEEGSKTALGQLLERRVRSKVDFKEGIGSLRQRIATDYEKLVAEKADVLNELEETLRKRLREWSNPSTEIALKWHYDPAKSVNISEPWAKASIGEDKFLGEVARLGHGMQRSFLVALLQEEAADSVSSGPTLLLGFEEPELYQHPPQAMHIARVLEQLTAKSDSKAQVVISTHSPHFVSSKGFENVRVVRKHVVDNCSLTTGTTYAAVFQDIAVALNETPALPSSLMAAIEQIMQPSQRELFFTRFAILVEGPEDIGFIATHLHIMDKWEEFRRHGCHFIEASGKTNLSRPLAIAKRLCIETFVVFDSDNLKVKPDQKARNEKDNRCLLTLAGATNADPNSTSHVLHDRVVMWASTILDAVLDEIGQDAWKRAEDEARKNVGYQDGVRRKNPLLIGATLEVLKSKGVTSSTLTQLCDRILSAAQGKQAPIVTPGVVAPPPSSSKKKSKLVPTGDAVQPQAVPAKPS